MIRLFVVAALLFATPALAEPVACYGEKGQPFYDPDFCRAIKTGHEALDATHRLLDKSEVIRQSIERKLDQHIKEVTTPKPRP